VNVSSPTGRIDGRTGTYASSSGPVIPEQEIISSIQSTTTPRNLRILICAFVHAHKNNLTFYGRQATPQLESELRVFLRQNLQRNRFKLPKSIAGLGQDKGIDAFIDALKSNADAIDSKCEIDFANDIRCSIPPNISDLLDGIPNQLIGDYFISDRLFPALPPPPPPQSHMQNIYEMVNGFVTESGEINVNEIGHTMFILANDIKNEKNDDLRLEKKALLGRLKILHGNRDLQMQLCLIKAPIPDAISRLGSFREATASTENGLTNAWLRRIALQAWIYPVRQEDSVGSCFATAPLNNLQMNNPVRMLTLIIEILASGSLERQTKGRAKVKIAANGYEQPQPNQPPFKSLQYAIVRTVADASHLMGHRNLHSSSFASGPIVKNLNKAMAKVNAHLSGTGGSHSPLPTVTWTPPTYDSNVQIWRSECNGTWIAHYSIGGSPSIPMTDFSEIDALYNQLNGHYKACNRILTKYYIAKAMRYITKIRQMYDETEATSPERVRLTEGGWIRGPMQAIGCCDVSIKMHDETEITARKLILSDGDNVLARSYTTADGVFRHWFPAMVSAAKNKLTRALAGSSRHVYNLVLDMSKALMDKLTPPDLDAILSYIRKGNEILFIDPNWEGCRGIGIRYSEETKRYILFEQIDEGTKTDIAPSDKNWKWLFKDLYAVE
jgi:hypothetical protein